MMYDMKAVEEEYAKFSLRRTKRMRSWRNWQTRKTKDLVGDHAGSIPVDRTKSV